MCRSGLTGGGCEPGFSSIVCSMPRFGGSPGGNSSGNTSLYSPSNARIAGDICCLISSGVVGLTASAAAILTTNSSSSSPFFMAAPNSAVLITVSSGVTPSAYCSEMGAICRSFPLMSREMQRRPHPIDGSYAVSQGIPRMASYPSSGVAVKSAVISSFPNSSADSSWKLAVAAPAADTIEPSASLIVSCEAFSPNPQRFAYRGSMKSPDAPLSSRNVPSCPLSVPFNLNRRPPVLVVVAPCNSRVLAMLSRVSGIFGFIPPPVWWGSVVAPFGGVFGSFCCWGALLALRSGLELN